eukprot:CFRG0509T1
MGRKKIEITKINDERNRQITFNKRKLGLMKKAYELSVLCGCDVGLVIFEKQMHQYSNVDMEGLFERFKEVGADEKEVLNNDDMNEQFGAKAEEQKRMKAASFNTQPGGASAEGQRPSMQGQPGVQPPKGTGQAQAQRTGLNPEQHQEHIHAQHAHQQHLQHQHRTMHPSHYGPRPGYHGPYPPHYAGGPPKHYVPSTSTMHWQQHHQGPEGGPQPEYINQAYGYPVRSVGQIRPPNVHGPAVIPPTDHQSDSTTAGEDGNKEIEQVSSSGNQTISASTPALVEPTIPKQEMTKKKSPNVAVLNITIPTETIAISTSDSSPSGRAKEKRDNGLLGEDLSSADLLVTPRLRTRTPRVRRGAEQSKGGMFHDDEDNVSGSGSASGSPSAKKRKI